MEALKTEPRKLDYDERISSLSDEELFLQMALEHKDLLQSISIKVPCRSADGIVPDLSRMLSIWTMVGINWGPVIDNNGGFIECTRAGMAYDFAKNPGMQHYKYLLMIDNDMCPPVWLPYLLVRHQQTMVGCCAMGGNAKHGPMLCFTVKDTEGNWRMPGVADDIPAKGLCKVGHVGTGAVMIRRDVMESFSYQPGDIPFYVPEDVRQNGYATGHLQRGEDIEFCAQVRAKGFDIYVDLEAHVGHRKSVVLEFPPDKRKREMKPETWVVAARGLKISGD